MTGVDAPFTLCDAAISAADLLQMAGAPSLHPVTLSVLHEPAWQRHLVQLLVLLVALQPRAIQAKSVRRGPTLMVGIVGKQWQTKRNAVGADYAKAHEEESCVLVDHSETPSTLEVGRVAVHGLTEGEHLVGASKCDTIEYHGART